MADLLFDRFAVLKLFPQTVEKSKNGDVLRGTDPVGKAYPSRLEDGSTGFRIRFNIQKNVDRTPNYTTIEIYNLGPGSRSDFEQQNSLVVLEAGYGDRSEVIFRGNIARTRTSRSGPDYVTKIEAGDGLFRYNASRVDFSVAAGANFADVINTLKGAFGYGTGEQRGIPANRVIQNGRTFSGPTREQLDEVLESANLEWSVQDGNLVILPQGSASGVPAVLLSPETGLVGIPQQKDRGIEFRSLLNPKIKPYQNVAIVSKFIDGVFRCLTINHVGDTFSGTWETQVEAV